jgi:hypothetical protein
MLPSVKSLINESWTLYRTNFKFFVKIVVWILVPSIILSILPAITTNTMIFLPINFFFSLISLFVGLFISIVLISSIKSLIKKEPIDLMALYNASYSKILSYFWISILAGLAVLGGTILLVIPGIIFSVWFSFAAIIFVIEGVKGTESLKSSKELVKGKFWPVLWRWVASYAIYGIILTIVVLIPVYIIGFSVGQPAAGFNEVSPWWAALLSNVIYSFAVPLFAAVGVLLYNGLKEEKETTVKPINPVNI